MEKSIEQLVPGTELTKELASGESHSYELDLEADQFVRVVADQQGIDVEVELLAPDGSHLITVDSLNGREGPENVVAVADARGLDKVEVRAVEAGAPSGEYRVTVPEHASATQADRDRTVAKRLFSPGEELRRKDTNGSLHRTFGRCQESLEVWRDLPDPGREADCLHRLGWIQDMLGESQSASGFSEAVLGRYRTASERRGEVIALNCLDGIRRRLWKTEEELDQARRRLDSDLQPEQGREGESASWTRRR